MIETAPGFAGVERVLAPNPGPMTLEGTNTYVVAGEKGAYVIDPGPDEDSHLAAVRKAASAHGGIAGILLTHSHADHTAAAPLLDAPILCGHVSPGDETTAFAGALPVPAAPAVEHVGPFEVIPTPGHAADHVCLTYGRLVFCGDLILGHGSSIVPPRAGGGSLSDYMRSLRRLGELEPDLLAPGHGPWVTDPRAKISAYTEHRLDRERRLLAALETGERSRSALLAAVWDDVPEPLRPAAAVAMQAHLEKLEEEGRLVAGELRD